MGATTCPCRGAPALPLQHCVGYEDAPLGMQAIKAAGFLKVGYRTA